jgi:hypothetical protein
MVVAAVVLARATQTVREAEKTLQGPPFQDPPFREAPYTRHGSNDLHLASIYSSIVVEG